MAPINVNKQILSKAHIQNSYTYSEKERSSGEKSLKLVSLMSFSSCDGKAEFSKAILPLYYQILLRKFK